MHTFYFDIESNAELNDVTKAGKNTERTAENRQLVELFQTKEWPAFETLLDKCVTENGKNMDFSVLDRPVLFEANHPLMLIARSGQERLIKHEAVLTLLNLKFHTQVCLLFQLDIRASVPGSGHLAGR